MHWNLVLKVTGPGDKINSDILDSLISVPANVSGLILSWFPKTAERRDVIKPLTSRLSEKMGGNRIIANTSFSDSLYVGLDTVIILIKASMVAFAEAVLSSTLMIMSELLAESKSSRSPQSSHHGIPLNCVTVTCHRSTVDR